MEMKRNKIKLLTSAVLLVLTSCSSVEIGSTIGSDKDTSSSSEAKTKLEEADEYIKENSSSVNKRYRNTYHYQMPLGWINDPNGFSYFNGKYSLFSQFNPYKPEWGGIHWGHMVSDDLVKWNLVETALAPDQSYDQGGCFSGTAIEFEGKQYVYYTNIDGVTGQNQSVAYSSDGIHFTKAENNPVIPNTLLPEVFSKADFRDPKAFVKDGRIYVLMVNKKESNNNRQVVQFSSSDPLSGFKYDGVVYSNNSLNGMLECPEVLNFDGKDVLILSAQGKNESGEYVHQNGDNVFYNVGTYDAQKALFTPDENLDTELDKGFDFYAAQALQKDGRNILTAWMNGWNDDNKVLNGEGYSGAYVLPRELTLKDNHIYQKPVTEIDKYLKNKTVVDDISLKSGGIQKVDNLKGTKKKLSFDIDLSGSSASSNTGIRLFGSADGENYVSISYDSSRKAVVFDRDKSGEIPSIGESTGNGFKGKRYAAVDPINSKIHLDIFLDVSSIEVFINDGYYTMTGLALPSDGEVSFFSSKGNGKISGISAYDIDVQ